ncbi:hypothetical protein [Paenarthrobacter sp. PH39-S1]|uniref:hypothetical protein n=1 Tax=Paenarthrobacter sp. PH39-S1 TaxID=3046204 RepID=UPI0024B9E737|nr:hypothetical protein [Paenarthrobacter sp. PH39-S1]MDJ0356193.1 hypothetical protein [Paenarthrobacter sp. PH39-S1]
MPTNLRLTPNDAFPENLDKIADKKLQILDSQIQRQLDREYVVVGEPNPETEFRHYEIDEEFVERESAESAESAAPTNA